MLAVLGHGAMMAKVAHSMWSDSSESSHFRCSKARIKSGTDDAYNSTAALIVLETQSLHYIIGNVH